MYLRVKEELRKDIHSKKLKDYRIKKDDIMMRGIKMYIRYDAHSKTHDNVHIAKRNERDGGHSCEHARNCDPDRYEDFDHDRLRRMVLDELHQELYSTNLSY